MKSEKGITLISVTIYVIVMTLLVAIISIITNYFYKNINLNSTQEDINNQYTKFISYFSEEVNKENNKILEINTEYSDSGNKISYIIFASGNQYTFIQENKSIYIGKVKIASYVKDCDFIQLSDTSVEINITFENGEQEINRTNTFNLKNSNF